MPKKHTTEIDHTAAADDVTEAEPDTAPSTDGSPMTADDDDQVDGPALTTGEATSAAADDDVEGPTPERLAHLHYVEHVTQRDLAKRYNRALTTVHRLIKKAGPPPSPDPLIAWLAEPEPPGPELGPHFSVMDEAAFLKACPGAEHRGEEVDLGDLEKQILAAWGCNDGLLRRLVRLSFIQPPKGSAFEADIPKPLESIARDIVKSEGFSAVASWASSRGANSAATSLNCHSDDPHFAVKVADLLPASPSFLAHIISLDGTRDISADGRRFLDAMIGKFPEDDVTRARGMDDLLRRIVGREGDSKRSYIGTLPRWPYLLAETLPKLFGEEIDGRCEEIHQIASEGYADWKRESDARAEALRRDGPTAAQEKAERLAEIGLRTPVLTLAEYEENRHRLRPGETESEAMDRRYRELSAETEGYRGELRYAKERRRLLRGIQAIVWKCIMAGCAAAVHDHDAEAG